MNIRIGKSTLVALLVLLLAVAAYWYWSPYLALRGMQSAARERDADSFNSHVDYPRLRESLKGQLSAMMAEEMATSKDSKNPFESLGAMLGMAMADKLVDAMVRPEVVMRGFESGKFSPRDSEGADAKSQNRTGWSVVRKGVDKLIAYPGAPGESTQADHVGVVFERSGFATWKLTELRMPARRSNAGQ